MRLVRSISEPMGIAVFIAVLVVAITMLALVRFGHFGLVFLPVGLLAIPILGRRIFGDPLPVFCLFLVIIVNFDFIRFGESRLTLDILVSAAFLWALIVRVGLDTRNFLASPVERAFAAFLSLTFISVILSVIAFP